MQKKSNLNLVRQNLRRVKQVYPELRALLTALRELTRALRLSLSEGEILCLDGRWYVTHAGLLRIAVRRRCLGIRTVLQERQSRSRRRSMGLQGDGVHVTSVEGIRRIRRR